MKIGDYIRTKYGISKIVAFYSNAIFNDKNKRIENNLIIKSSPNIIDLIEEGDYVNGEKVITVGSYFVNTENNTINKWDFKSIVTKEQFESMSYRVGD